jgi:polar amino acid transport system permease protein
MMLKSSSLVSVVGVVELTRMAQDLAASTYRPLELYAAAGLIYLVINVVVALLGRGLEAQLSWGRA